MTSALPAHERLPQQVAILEAHDYNTQPHPADPPGASKPPAGRFVYASGARPLAGYTIKRGVGQGGFGEIYYATSDGGKDVALKLIRRNLDVELRGIHQCLNLKHPNLLDLYDVRQDDKGDTWVVMEYVADPSLDVLLARRPAGFSPEEALCWIHGIGAGVAYLHDRGIVHRDLKPGNIFLDEGVVKVGDYGLSKFISCSRRSGHTESVGTVHYMAPEVANGRYGKELDVYAMGVILYELLTGRVPFEGESIAEVLMKHLTAKPDVSMIAEPYRSVIVRALEKDPEKRYRSAAEMLAALPPCPAIGPDRLPLRDFMGVAYNRTETPANYHFDDTAQDNAKNSESLASDAGEAEKRASRRRKSAYVIIAFTVGLLLAKNGPGPGEPPLAGAPLFVLPFLLLILILVVAKLRRLPLTSAQRRDVLRRSFRDGGSFCGRLWQEPKTSRALKTIALMAMILWQYVNVATLAAVGSNRYVNWADIMYMVLPSAILVFYFVATRLVVWSDKKEKQNAEHWSESPTVVAPPSSPTPPKAAEPVRWPRYGERPAPAFVLKPPRERLADMIGSLLGSALVAAVMSGVMALVEDYWANMQIRPEQFVWLWLVGLVGSWAILIPSKLWEGHRGDPMLRRFVMMVIGMGLGLAAFGASEVLLVNLRPATLLPDLPRYNPPSSFYGIDGQPMLLAYVVCFGTLFLLMRWWRQTDPLRRARLSLWTVFVSVLVAVVVTQAWKFPEPWLPMVAGTISVAVQLAGPCDRANRRRR